MKKEIKDPAYKGEVVDLNVADYTAPEDFVVEVIDRQVQKSKSNLKNAPIVVAGGYGVGSRWAQAAPLSTPDG